MNTEKRAGLIVIGVILYIISVVLQLPTLLRSGFFDIAGSKILLSWGLALVFILLIAKFLKSAAKVALGCLCAILLSANWSQIMLYFSSHEPYEEASKNVFLFTVIVAGCVFGGWIGMHIIKKFRKIVCALLPIISVILAVFVLNFADLENETCSIYFSDNISFQPAFFMVFMMLISFAGYFDKRNGIAIKVLYMAGYFMLMFTMVLYKEYGLPVMCYIACALVYLFFFRSDKKSIVNDVIFIGAPILFFAIAMFVSPELRDSFFDKFNTRKIGNDNYHSMAAYTNLKISGLFGTYKYHHLPEASSDYALNSNTHYWGYLWLIVMFMSFSLVFFTVVKEQSELKSNNIVNNLQKVVLGLFSFIILYNIFSNLCIAPMIGVQILFSGVSKSVAILSGGMLGVLLYDKNFSKENFSFNKKETDDADYE